MRCPYCDGEGQVANTEQHEPWSAWATLPVQSALAVLLGVVKPTPCPECGGSGLLTLSQEAWRAWAQRLLAENQELRAAMEQRQNE
jgi:DnaJ-class molecular chaperone